MAEKSARFDALQLVHDCKPLAVHGTAVECSAQKRQRRESVDLPLPMHPRLRAVILNLERLGAY